MKTALEWRDSPTMNPRNTRQLRSLIERRTFVRFWGRNHFVIPRLVSEVFGNGKTLVALAPMMFRPERFVVRIDSSWGTSWFDDPPNPDEWLDRVYDAIEEEFIEWPWAKKFGFKWSDDDSADCNLRISFVDGAVWWEMKWPRIKRGRIRRRVADSIAREVWRSAGE